MLKSLQAGRGVAALAVAGFHLAGACALIPAMRGSLVAAAFRHGNIGVDFFFVLSGFIIMFAHERDIGHPERLMRYLRKRVIRLYPMYWFYTALVVVAVSLGFSALTLPNSPLDWLSVTTLIPFTSVAPPLNVAWTLFYEVAFYATFATLIINRNAGLIIMGVWLALIVISNVDGGRLNIAAIWSSRLCLNFFIGMIAYLIHTRITRWMAFAFVGFGAIILLVALFTVDFGMSSQTFGSVISISSGALITGAASLERNKRWRLGLFAGLGDASYTVYLVHMHIEAPLIKALMKYDISRHINPDILFVSVLLSTILIAYLLYLSIEKFVTSVLNTKISFGVLQMKVAT